MKIEIMTKEEINKACDNYVGKECNSGDVHSPLAFKAGVELAKSKLYSEEEVLELLLKSKIETSNLYYEDMKNWFETIKKK